MDSHEGKHLLAAGEGILEVAGCIFLHPHCVQNQDQTLWVFPEATSERVQ